MRANPLSVIVVVLAVILAVIGAISCGGSIAGSGPDGSTQPVACGSLSECACYEASDRCAMRTESCWCPSVCDTKVVCVCGGGRFLGCEDRAVSSGCDAELARVQALCAGQPFASMIGGLCSSNPSCIAGCLSQLGSADACTQIDCSFCTACDCLAPSPQSPLRTCVDACNLPSPPLR